MNSIPIRTPLILAGVGALAALLVTDAAGMQGTITSKRLPLLTPQQEQILRHMSIVFLDDGQGGLQKTIRITGANWQIVDGSGSTGGTPTGIGNLIVGYNELRGSGDNRTGSHNIVGGKENNYNRFGGLVVSKRNSILGDWSTVSGGSRNIADGNYAAISGGGRNIADASYASVSGGFNAQASGSFSSVGGGFVNSANGKYSSVSGGSSNVASGNRSSVSGGRQNEASGYYSSIAGGIYNEASNLFSSVTGGQSNQASGTSSTVSGGLFNTASSIRSSVSGGANNTASGYSSSVSGGSGRSALGPDDWRAGTLFETN